MNLNSGLYVVGECLSVNQITTKSDGRLLTVLHVEVAAGQYVDILGAGSIPVIRGQTVVARVRCSVRNGKISYWLLEVISDVKQSKIPA